MADLSTRSQWLIFLALGFMWGSSYLFIKLAVDDFGTFTLVALRLAIGAALLWVVARVAGQQMPRERRIYGHLFVMAIVNIVIPFALITWAEQSVDSSIAAILTSAVPLFAIVIAPLATRSPPTTATITYCRLPMNIVSGCMRLDMNCAPNDDS